MIEVKVLHFTIIGERIIIMCESGLGVNNNNLYTLFTIYDNESEDSLSEAFEICDGIINNNVELNIHLEYEEIRFL